MNTADIAKKFMLHRYGPLPTDSEGRRAYIERFGLVIDSLSWFRGRGFEDDTEFAGRECDRQNQPRNETKRNHYEYSRPRTGFGDPTDPDGRRNGGATGRSRSKNQNHV